MGERRIKRRGRERDGGHDGFAAGWSEETRRAEAIPVPVFTMGEGRRGEGERGRKTHLFRSRVFIVPRRGEIRVPGRKTGGETLIISSGKFADCGARRAVGGERETIPLEVLIECVGK